jgi:hypothetical protein
MENRMAIAKIEDREVEVIVRQTKNEPVILLELSKEEASTLYDILKRIGGCPDTTRRKYAQSIFDAMAKATGHSRWDSATDVRDKSSIYFT